MKIKYRPHRRASPLWGAQLRLDRSGRLLPCPDVPVSGRWRRGRGRCASCQALLQLPHGGALLHRGQRHRRSEVATLRWADVDLSDGGNVIVTLRRSADGAEERADVRRLFDSCVSTAPTRCPARRPACPVRRRACRSMGRLRSRPMATTSRACDAPTPCLTASRYRPEPVATSTSRTGLPGSAARATMSLMRRTAPTSNSRSVRYRADTWAKWSLNRAARPRSSPSCVSEAISTVNPGVSPVARRVLWMPDPTEGASPVARRQAAVQLCHDSTDL